MACGFKESIKLADSICSMFGSRYSRISWLLLLVFVQCCLLQQSETFSILNTTCDDVTITISIDSDVYSLTSTGGNSLSLELNRFLERSHLTLYHSTGYSQNELSFHQIGEGSRITHELGIEVFRGTNVTWSILFNGNSPRFSGFYEIDIGGCRTVANITILTPVMRRTGSMFNLTVPEIAVDSLNIVCPFVLSFFSLRIFYNGSQVRIVDVFYDSPREIITFSPSLLDPSITVPGPYVYDCYGVQNGIGFESVSIMLSINASQSSYSLTMTVREEDNISIDLEAICLPFYSRFISADSSTAGQLPMPQMNFTLNGISIIDRNLTIAKLAYNGSFSCHVVHTVFEAQTEILQLFVKPLNVCAHSNGGCEHLCSTYLGADSFNCSCRSGYQLSPNQLGCEDINECLSPSLHSCSYPSQRCLNQPVGRYSCECAPGFTRTSKGCEDVDECALEDANCMHECSNTRGGYSCSCRSGYTLLSIDNSTCIGSPLDSPSFLVTPVILASFFGAVLMLAIFIILCLMVAVCKRSRRPTRLKYEVFTKRLSGDFKCHQQVDNPVFRLDQGSIFSKRISPRKNLAPAYGMLRDLPDDLTGNMRPRSSNYRPRSLEQAALSDGGLTVETDDLSDDVMLPKPLSTHRSPYTILRHDSTQSVPSKDSSLDKPGRNLPHSNMVPVLPSLGDHLPFMKLKARADSTSKSERNSHVSTEFKIDNTFC